MARALSIVGLAALLSAAFAGVAGAKAMFANPNGGVTTFAAGQTCAASAPTTSVCTLPVALQAAATGDDLTLQSGTYTTALSDGGKSLTIHGPLPAAGVRPSIQVSGGTAVTLTGANSTLTYVDIVNTGASGVALDDGGSLVDRVTALAPGGSGLTAGACVLRKGTLRNSICAAKSLGVAGVQAVSTSTGAVTLTVRNVTAVNTAAAGRGIRAEQTTAPTTTGQGLTVNVFNTIAQGAPFDISNPGNSGRSIEADADVVNAVATVNVSSTNMVNTLTSGAGNAKINASGETFALVPLFVDPVNFNYRVKVGSPTIGLGTDTQANLGSYDLDGAARQQGALDLGANELPNPAPPTTTTTTTTTPPPTTTTTTTTSPPPPTTTTVPITTLPTTTTPHPPTTTTTPSDTTPPVVTKLSLVPTGFAVKVSGQHQKASVSYGASLHFALSEGSHVKATISRASHGRRVGKSCEKPSRANAAGHVCTRYVTVTSFVPSTKSGRNTITFSGVVNHHALGHGSYHLTLVATDAAGNHSKHTTVAFRIVRG